jgi:hypothetical protein
VEIPLLIILIIFIASTVFATFGFGDALLALPFLTIILGVKTATPLLAMSGLTLALCLLGSGFKNIVWKEAFKLILGSLVGVPLGVLALRYGDERIMRMIVGSVIILISLYNLFKPNLSPIPTDRYAPVFGMMGGVLGGAFNVSGPPVVLYGAMRAWTPMVFTGMMQAFFVPTDIFVIIGHLQSGLLNENVLHLYLWCLPFLLLAVFIGTQIKKRISVTSFQKWVFILILFSGIMLVVKSVLSA